MCYDFDPSRSWDLHCMEQDMREARAYAAYGIKPGAVCHGTCKYCHEVVATGGEELYEDAIYVCSKLYALIDGYDESTLLDCLMGGEFEPIAGMPEDCLDD